MKPVRATTPHLSMVCTIPVIHGSADPDGSFFFWGEGQAQCVGKKRGRKPATPKPSSHPFAISTAALKEALKPVLPPSALLSASERVLYLPTTDQVPHPSPELVPGRGMEGKGKTLFAPWSVPVVTVPLSAALPFLLSGNLDKKLHDSYRDTSIPHENAEGNFHIQEIRPGRSLAAWSVAALFATELVARGAFLPGFTPAGPNSITGVWRPALGDEDQKRLDELAAAMPPVTRAHLTGNGRDGEPVRIFIDTAVQFLVTESARSQNLKTPERRKGSARTMEEVWYLSLMGSEGAFPADSPSVRQCKSWLAGPEHLQLPDRCSTCFTVQEPNEGESDWRVGFFLQAKDDPTLLIPAGEVWSGRSGAVARMVSKETRHPQERMLYDLGMAAKFYPPIREALKRARPDGIPLPPEEVYGFLAETAPLLKELGCSVLLPSWWHTGRQHPSIRMHLKGQVKKGRSSGAFSLKSIVSFDWKIAIGDEEVSPEEFAQLTLRKLPLMKVRGRWIVFDPDEVRRVISAFRKEYPGKEISLADALALSLGGPTDQEIPLTTLVTDTTLKEFLDRLISEQFPGPVVLPELFTGTLRPYQETGVTWLSMRAKNGMGACLADDMGLGKTVQVIAYMALQKNDGPTKKKTLLVCPMSIIGNWMRELHRFAPSLGVYIHHGAERCTGDWFGRMQEESDVVITSYQTVQRDEKLLASSTWDCIVLDEAQNIKNHATKQARAVRKLSAASRIALTGTPVENRLAELWSVMDFLNPGYLGTAASFQKQFAAPIERQHDATRALALKKIVRPFLLRRVKTDRQIISDLPEKLIVKEFCPLTKEQVSLYESAVQDLLEKLDSLKGVARKGAVLVTLMRLKQICNHPSLFFNDGSALTARSGKLERLLEILEEVLANGERALLFTQFASFGGMLKPYLETVFFTEVLFLHGKTKREDRDRMVARFAEKKGPKLFILSLKAGGTGLNLTAANHVFHIDRWWNPAVEDQATDRAFRIGQSKNVEVHLMIAGGTLEEKIDAVLEEKRALAGSIIGNGEDWITSLSTEELHELLALRKSTAGGLAL